MAVLVAWIYLPCLGQTHRPWQWSRGGSRRSVRPPLSPVLAVAYSANTPIQLWTIYRWANICYAGQAFKF